MAKSVKLLLVENVDSLGIVGDVVNVRTGYARNFLLPRALATQPNDDLIKQLAAKRAAAQEQLAVQRKQREETTGRLQGVEIELVRSCNDQGVLYGAITQQEVATVLGERGFVVKPRDVRLPGSIKRIEKYDIHIKLDSDLDSTIKLVVKPDRELPKDADAEHKHETKPKGEEKPAEAGAAPAATASDKPQREERRDRGDRPDRGDRGERGERFERKRVDIFEQALAADKARVVGWGGSGGDKKADQPASEGDKKADKKEKKPAKGDEKAEKKAKK